MTEAERTRQAGETPQHTSNTGEADMALKLAAEMLAGRIVDIRPQLDFAAEAGFSYPDVEQTLQVGGSEALAVLESLTHRGILKKNFFDRLLRCPQCQSLNIRPTVHCPACGSGDIVQGRILEHLACKHVDIEDAFLIRRKYMCPRCEVELRSLGIDYESQGVLRKCRACGDIFKVPVIRWRCLRCSSLAEEDGLGEVSIYSYSLEEANRSWLEFELHPKQRLMEFLSQLGYEVTENATVKGRSGADHTIDMLAFRDDGVVAHNIAIGILIARDRIGLDRILEFDVKAYDGGLLNKMLITIPEPGEEARRFAQIQRIRVLEPADLEILLSSPPGPARESATEPFQFESRSQFMQYLGKQGYEVQENAVVMGRSGAGHSIDMLASRDEGIITHRIAIGTEVAGEPMGLDRLFDFDDKAYDAGILNKVFIAVPGLTPEAKQYARRQRIRVFEAAELEPTRT